MKTIWERGKGGQAKYVTREEMPGLTREILADLILAALGLKPKAPDTTLAALAPKPEPHPRAPGHKHRGRCGPNCFKK